MAERQRVKPRMMRDDLFPALESWWPPGVTLDELRERSRGEAPVYFTEEREAEINSWWAQAQQRNRERMNGGP